jgi:hypothetical protein
MQRSEDGIAVAVPGFADHHAHLLKDYAGIALTVEPAVVGAFHRGGRHASLLSAELIARMAETGVTACIQPSFAVTDAAQLGPALGPGRCALAYPWQPLMAAGVPVIAGSDYPVEALDPLAGLARLVSGRSERAGSPGRLPRRRRRG